MADRNPEAPQYDVIVVGGGPAGSSAAYFLGRAGKRVLILEKERLPRYKTCGGGLSVRFLREQFPFSFDPIIKNQASRVSYVYRGREMAIPLAPGAIGMVMREDLDEYLLARTQAEILQEAVVCAITELSDRVQVEIQDGRSFTASYVIGADGANSVVAHAIGLRKRRTLAAAIEAEAPVSPEVMQRLGDQVIFIFGEIHYGYLWIFPKADHLTVGIGALRPKRGELQRTLKRVMARYGIDLENAQLRGHPIPIYTRREPVSSARTLLVGDAAGLADPLSGEGIRFAIKSGKLAAEAILEGGSQQYPRRLQRAIGANHMLTTLLSLAFYHALGPLLFLGAPNPFSTQAVVEMLSDRMSAVGFIAVGIWTFPVFVITELAARFFAKLGLARLSAGLRARVYPEAVKTAYQSR